MENEAEVWEEEINDFNETVEPNNQLGILHPLIYWMIHLIALLQKKHYIPNVAVSMLLQFLHAFFMILSRTGSKLEFLEKFPKSVYQMQKHLNRNSQIFKRYVVCEKCSSIYEYDNCLERSGTRILPKVCKYKASRRAVLCNGELLKSVNLLNGKTLLYPRKVFCYMSLKNYFSSLLNRSNFIDACNQWKELTGLDESSNVYKSVYDGEIWKNLKRMEIHFSRMNIHLILD